jgi:RNA polymerase sigma factor (TIGR02999 family)
VIIGTPPDTRQPGEVTRLLAAWKGGDTSALEKLLPMVSAELHALAFRQMAAEKPGHTLQPTALVNEAYIRLAGDRAELKDRASFFAAAAVVMRRILVDHARRRKREKRGDGMILLGLDNIDPPATEPPVDVLALDLALDKLAAIDPRKSQIVELRFFGGLSEPETAGALDLPLRTVQREWSFARAWLVRHLQTT